MIGDDVRLTTRTSALCPRYLRWRPPHARRGRKGRTGVAHSSTVEQHFSRCHRLILIERAAVNGEKLAFAVVRESAARCVPPQKRGPKRILLPCTWISPDARPRAAFFGGSALDVTVGDGVHFMEQIHGKKDQHFLMVLGRQCGREAVDFWVSVFRGCERRGAGALLRGIRFPGDPKMAGQGDFTASLGRCGAGVRALKMRTDNFQFTPASSFMCWCPRPAGGGIQTSMGEAEPDGGSTEWALRLADGPSFGRGPWQITPGRPWNGMLKPSDPGPRRGRGVMQAMTGYVEGWTSRRWRRGFGWEVNTPFGRMRRRRRGLAGFAFPFGSLTLEM